MWRLLLLSEKLGFSQKLGQAAGGGEGGHSPGLGGQDEEVQEMLWADTRSPPFGELGG